MQKQVKRGDMYYADLSPVVGSEQGGFRPVLIVQNDTGNRHSPTVIVAAITGKPKKAAMPTHCPLPARNGLDTPSTVMLEQVRTIDKLRLCDYIGQLDRTTMKGIDRAIAVSMGLEMNRQKCSDVMLLTLCAPCAAQFYDSGDYIMRRANRKQEVKETCCYCGCRSGFDFVLTPETR